MQVTETHSEGLKREYKVNIAAAEIDEKISGRLEELGSKVKVPGFRPGKVPLEILKQRFGKSVLGEVLERAVNDSSAQAMSERGLRPAMQPKIEITAFDEGKDLEYTLAVELLPEINPMDFSKLELERCNITLEDSEVEEALANLAKSQKRTQPLKKPRKAQTGDVLVIDFKGTVDGEEFPGMAAEDHHLELGSSAFVEGFEEQLIDADIGETRNVMVTFPEAYVNDKLSGKDAVFVVTLKNILESVPVDIDDAFAASLGEKDLEAVRQKLRDQIGGEYKQQARARLKRQLLDKLAEAHDFQVPGGMLDIEFDTIWKQIEADRKQGRIDPEDAEKDEEELKAEYRAIAERRVRLGLLVSEVGQRNGVEVGQEELNRALLMEAQRYPGKEREVFEFYQKTPEAMANLRAPLFEDKVVDFIVDLAKVTERDLTAEKFREEMEREIETERKGKGAKKAAKARGADSGASSKPGGKPAKKAGGKKKAAKKSS
ncbi:MAG: trigger factor [Kiloniellales bacterium]